MKEQILKLIDDVNALQPPVGKMKTEDKALAVVLVNGVVPIVEELMDRFATKLGEGIGKSLNVMHEQVGSVSNTTVRPSRIVPLNLEDILGAELLGFELSVRTRKFLARRNITTLGQLLKANVRSLANEMGSSSQRELNDLLSAFGI